MIYLGVFGGLGSFVRDLALLCDSVFVSTSGEGLSKYEIYHFFHQAHKMYRDKHWRRARTFDIVKSSGLLRGTWDIGERELTDCWLGAFQDPHKVLSEYMERMKSVAKSEGAYESILFDG